jgi:hypothetical protein
MKSSGISSVKFSEISGATWRATHVLKPDLKLLSESILDYGIVSPIVVQKRTMQIIDGYHRWIVCGQDKAIQRSLGGVVPVVFFDVDNIDAMVMHIRLNRARGQLVAKYMSSVVKDIALSKKYSLQEMEELFNMNMLELDLLMDGSLLKVRKVKEHTYSNAWVPIEAPAGAVDSVVLERPPNEDR